ncbi:MAG: undecaprenyl-diphosphate phosphatase [Clostridia bacterium]|nr:undecaprenyl-diphosphate phosphatase [Clostridia bacterium]
MDLIIKSIIMGIVEGITEFLPVSSTGHLIIAGDLIDFKGNFAKMFDITIQLGAILAVIYFYRKKIFDSLKHLKPKEWGFDLWLKIAVAFVPSALLGFLLNDYIKIYLFSTQTVAIALILGAIMLLLVEKYSKNFKIDHMDKIGIKKAFLIGLAQCMSLFPGMSRSASTIMGGMLAGLSVKAAAEFSFFLAIPTMIAATGYSLLKELHAMTTLEWTALAVGFAVSFLVALLVVGKFLSFLSKHSLKSFAYYRLVVGSLMLALVLTGILGT